MKYYLTLPKKDVRAENIGFIRSVVSRQLPMTMPRYSLLGSGKRKTKERHFDKLLDTQAQIISHSSE